jgi:hypothetical protein
MGSFLSGFWLIVALPGVLSIASALVFVLLLRRSVKWALLFLGLLVIVEAGITLGAVYTFGGAFGPGALMCFAGPIAAAVTGIVLLLKIRKFVHQFPRDRARILVYLLGGLFIAALQLAPAFGPVVIRSVCFVGHQAIGDTIVEAMEAYRADSGSYPTELEELVPRYLPAIPVPPCARLSSHEDEYDLHECRSGELLLITDSVDGMGIERHNLSTGNWSSISFLDGACSHLR